MTDNNSKRRFAFGRNTFHGCECPAVKADKDPETRVLVAIVARKYDKHARQMSDFKSGILTEQKAKEAWFKAIREVDKTGYTPKADVGREIAEELGWKE